MPRRARLRLPGVPLHIVQRGINRTACFFSDGDRLCYLQLLAELAPAHACGLHAYVLMTNHVHLLMTPETPQGPSLLMKNLGQRYVQYLNRAHGRTGGLWEGRFRSSFVDSTDYLLRCQRYIELNPVRAGMVSSPGDYPWSSHATNALGTPCPFLSPHAEFLSLGPDPDSRRAAYIDLFRIDLEPWHLETIRRAANAGYALGSDEFQDELQARIGRRVSQGDPGRPRKRTASC